MNVSILFLRWHSDPGEIFSATVRIKVQLVANPVGGALDKYTLLPSKYGTLCLSSGKKKLEKGPKWVNRTLRMKKARTEFAHS